MSPPFPRPEKVCETNDQTRREGAHLESNDFSEQRIGYYFLFTIFFRALFFLDILDQLLI